MNKYGAGYGWDITVFTRVEDFWAKRGFLLPERDPDESFELIRERILELNPEAKRSRIDKFIRGK